MEISPDIEKLFIQWAQEAAREAAKREERLRVLPLRKKIEEYLQRLNTGGGVLTFIGNYKIRDYIKLHTDYAKLFHRNEIRKAQTQVTLDQCARYGNDLVEVSDHNTDCEICQEYEGKIYSISGTSTKYPVLKEKPPFCLGCQHSIFPTSEEAIEARKIFG